MNNIDIDRCFTFDKKSEADSFCKRMNKLAYNVGWVTVNDILRERKEPVIPGGGDRGYSKKDVRKVKPEKAESKWLVTFPKPGKLVRDIHGYWTVERILELESIEKGGG